MDGNHTDDEIDFVEALAEEMPTVDQEMAACAERIDACEQLLAQLRTDQSVQTMNQLKAEVEIAGKMVDDKERLAGKLEPEIIQWDPLGKLIRRDEELEFVAAECAAIEDYLKNEEQLALREMTKLDEQDAKLSREEKIKLNTGPKKEGLTSMLQDVEELNSQNNELLGEHGTVFEVFNPEIPDSVLKARSARIKKVVHQNVEDPSRENIYYMLTVNCTHRPPIKEMVAKIRVLKVALEQYELKWQKLKIDLNQKLNAKKKYKAVKGDQIDEMFAEALNRSAYADLKVVRLEAGKYMFGTKKILAKIINNRLVIRVGGGYTSVDEFIEQYGRMELMKMIAAEELHAQHEHGGDGHHKAATDQLGHAADLKRIKEKTDRMMASHGGAISATMRQTMTAGMQTY
jgi:hypothetical protein